MPREMSDEDREEYRYQTAYERQERAMEFKRCDECGERGGSHRGNCPNEPSEDSDAPDDEVVEAAFEELRNPWNKSEDHPQWQECPACNDLLNADELRPHAAECAPLWEYVVES